MSQGYFEILGVYAEKNNIICYITIRLL